MESVSFIVYTTHEGRELTTLCLRSLGAGLELPARAEIRSCETRSMVLSATPSAAAISRLVYP
jgi:hypothetical protein